VRLAVTTICCRLIALLALAAAAAAPDATPALFPVAPRWTIDLGAPPVVNAPPISDGGRIYVALRSGTVIARAIADGQEVWRRDLASDGPLAADAGLVFAAAADSVHGVRGADGALLWERPLPGISAPLVAKTGWVLAAAGRSLTAIRGRDGGVVWQRDLGPISHRPAIDGPRVYVALNDGRVAALDIESGATIWDRQFDGAAGEPLGAGDRVYFGAGDRRFYCVKADSGEVDWSWRVGAGILGAPAIDDERVYFVALDNVLRALDRRSGVQQWQHAIRRRAAAGPAVVRGVVLLPSSTSGVPPELGVDDQQTPRLAVVTGSLAEAYELTLIGPAVDPPIVTLSELPGQPVATPR
jgi:outer membrane protein assembly factor BamB